MARAGAPSRRTRSDEHWIERQNALVAELHKLDRLVGIRNVILQRLQEHLTEEEKRALSQS